MTFEEYANPGLVKGLKIYAVRFFRKPEDIEDLVQSTLLQAFRKFDQYNPQYKFSTWTYRILKSIALNKIRRINVRNRIVKIVPIEVKNRLGEFVQRSIPTRNPEQAYNARIDAQKALSTLKSTKQRARLLLRWGYDVPYEEMDSTKSKVNLVEESTRLRKKMKEFLEGR